MAYETPSPLLLSRVAESAYWAGRYLERAEGTARLIKSHSDLIIDLPKTATLGWSPLLAVLGLGSPAHSHGHDRVDARHASASADTTEERVVHRLGADPEEPSSVLASIASLHGNLRVARVIMPVEAAEVLSELHSFVADSAEQVVDRRTRAAWLTAVIRRCQTLSGILADTMSHDDAYCFFTIGRQLERADLTSRVLDVQAKLLTGRRHDPLRPYLDISWFAALRSVSALQAFRRSGLPPTPDAKVAFLLHDAKCPRSVESCLIEIGRWLLEIPRHQEAMGRCASAQALLEEAKPSSLVSSGLHEFSDALQLAIAGIHDTIDLSWFQVEAASTR